MINEQILQGNWNEIKGKLREKWGQLTNDDLQSFSGDVDQLVGLIQLKTGQGREAIEAFLDKVAAEGASFVEHAADNLREYASRGGERLQEVTEDVADSLRHGYEEAEEMVRRRPSEAAAVCFGAGVLAGLLVALLIHRK